ncbi:MAG: adenylate/guanylate cyclase domain-containing protein [Dehalococcoidia bacterium]|nr:adenylate/guanylate cyclase domain-containing protein [Dehalococcoidia bacterium]
MKCSNCGSDVPQGFKFCGECGAKLAPHCPSCDAEVPEGFKFCGNCGAPLQGAAAAPPPPPPPPRESPVAEASNLQEELKQVTILFGDVSGFTAMSETLQPEQVRLIMDACLKQLASEVKRFGGTVDKFSGDNIMALFGAPIAHEDDPERAVMAAINMQEALTRFAADLEKKMGFSLQMRMGVNTGPVIAGMTGSDQAEDYTVMGDAVNLASRLEHAAEKGKVLVGEGTYKATRAVIDYNELAPIMVKGKIQPVPIWEVIGPKARPESRRGIRGLESPIVGRDDELTRLKHVYEAVTAKKRPHLVTIWGPPEWARAGFRSNSRNMSQGCRIRPS